MTEARADVPGPRGPEGATGAQRLPGTAAVVVAVGVIVAVALAATWWRLWRGADMANEGFSVLVPWRWALGDRPFVDEQNLAQAAGLLAYPFVKLYALIGGNDVTGLVLYGRHLYLVLAVLVAGSAYLIARRTVPGPLSALVGAPIFAFVLFDTPQLTANTLCALLLTAGAALGAVTVLGGPRGYALAAGVAFGLACVAYPTVLFMVPFVAVCLAFALGHRAVAMLADGDLLHVPESEPEPSGLRAWRALSFWALGGALVVLPVGGLVFLLAGRANLVRCWAYTLGLARSLDQLGGASKAVEITGAFFAFIGSQWHVMVAAALAYAVYRVRPGVGRWLLLGTPIALWVTATTSSLHAAGAVIAYALGAPYLYLFVSRARREAGARLLWWVWAPAVLLGVMTAYTSADGFVHAAVGLYPGLLAAGLFLAWGLEPLGGARATLGAWPALAGLAGVIVVALVLQVQFQEGGVPLRALSARMESGPWWGIAVTADQQATLDGFAADLSAQARGADQLLIYPQGAGYYLYWPGDIAANTYQLFVPDPGAPLPKATVSYYRRHREVPTLVAHVLDTAGMSAAELQGAGGGLEYPPSLVRPLYAFQRKPADETTEEVLARLPRR